MELRERENTYGLERLPLALIPTYPSSGSENGLGAVSVDSRTGDFGTAYGIAADYAILCPKYSLTLDREMTTYTGLVTLVQLSAGILGDRNRMSYDAGFPISGMCSKRHGPCRKIRMTSMRGVSS